MTCISTVRARGYRSASSGRSEDAGIVEQLTRAAQKHLYVPATQLYIELEEVLGEIKEYTALADDWNLEGGRVVDTATAECASELVRLAYHAARQVGLIWESPAVGPLHDGGLSVEWDREGRRTVIFLRPDQPDQPECVVRAAGGRPERIPVSTARDAVRCALWALGAEE